MRLIITTPLFKMQVSSGNMCPQLCAQGPSLQAILLILLTWLLLIPIFAGIGALAARVFLVRLTTPESWFLLFWTGWALTIAFLQIWHFAFPVNDAARLTLIMLGLLGLALNRQSVQDVLAGTWRARTLYAITLSSFFLVFAVWLANRATTAPNDVFDTGMYHLNVLRWTSTYSIVPGLGNLHSRLGHATAYFLYPSLLNTGIWLNRSYHIANGLILLVFFVQCAYSGMTLLFRRDILAGHPYHTFMTLCLPVALFLTLTKHVPSVANDAILYVLGFLIAGQIIKFTHRQDSSEGARHATPLFITLIATVGIAIKFSFAPLAGGFLLLALIKSRPPWRQLARIGGIGALVMLPTLTRSAIMTGYPAYPLIIAALPVDWRIPESYAHLETDFIRAQGRIQGAPMEDVLGNWNWVGTWFKNMLAQYYHFDLPIIIASGCIIVLLFRRSKIRWHLLVPPSLAIIVWFLTAPHIRFLGAALGILAFGLVLDVMANLQPSWQRRILIGLLVLLLLPSARLLLQNPWIAPGDTEHGLHPLQEASLERYTTRSGLQVWTPVGGTQCWDAPLPCTPYLHPALMQRNAPDLNGGFIFQPLPDDPPQVID